MIVRTILILVSAMLAANFAGAQPGVHTSASGGEVLRLIRREKLDLILPGAMRDNGVDMWIHVTRHGDPDPMAYWFGNTYGYLVFTDLGDRIERAAFGSGGSVPDIDVRGSDAFARTISSYGRGYQLAFGYGDEVYDEFTEFVAERDPQTIAVNTSEWLAEADGLSHTSYLKLVSTLGPGYAERIVSAENLITDFLVRRTVREVAEQINNLEAARQLHQAALARIEPGRTTIREITTWAREEAYQRHLAGFGTWGRGGIRLYYTAVSEDPPYPPDARYWIWHGDYVFQRGDFFAFNVGVNYLGFGTDTKSHAYILREGETAPPESIQKLFDLAVAGQWIMRPHMRVGMTAKESLDAMVAAMEAAGYLYTPFVNSGIQGIGRNARRQPEPRLRDHPGGARRRRSAGIRHRQPRLRHRRHGHRRSLDDEFSGRPTSPPDPGESHLRIRVHGSHEHSRTTGISAGDQHLEPSDRDQQGRRVAPAAEREDLPHQLIPTTRRTGAPARCPAARPGIAGTGDHPTGLSSWRQASSSRSGAKSGARCAPWRARSSRNPGTLSARHSASRSAPVSCGA